MKAMFWFAALTLCSAAAPIRQPARTILGIRETQFTVNGKRTFLLGASYYAGIGASEDTLKSDLASLRRRGFNWIRVWATWRAFDHDISAVDTEGNPRAEQMAALVKLVNACDRQGMIVDVTLSRGDGVKGSPKLQGLIAHKRAVEAVTRELAPYRNWYLDLSNERNIQDSRYTSFEDLGMLSEAARRVMPALAITASHGGDIDRDEFRKYIEIARVDFVTPHRPRGPESPSHTEAKTREYLGWMKGSGKSVPVHYQEPFRRGYAEWNPESPAFLEDLRGAVRGGAAGWCFHNGSTRGTGDTRRSFDLRGGPLFDVLEPAELEVVSRAADVARRAR